MNLTTWLMTALGVAVGVLAGALLNAWWLRRKASAKLRFPAKWPLGARGLVTSDEHEVWKWLRNTFHDHAVMVKTPVLRFTIPLDKEKDKKKGKAESERWLELLDGVYTTFTICTMDGKVVGCVDVPGKRGMSKVHHELKETLLSDCGIGYTVVHGTRLPTGNAMRVAFLGEIPAELAKEEHHVTRGGSSTFHADLDAFTKQRVKAAQEAAQKEINKDTQGAAQPAKDRNAGFNPEGTGSIKAAGKPHQSAGQWDDSFIQYADTRPNKIE